MILPHAMAYNAPAAREAMDRIAPALGVPDAPTGLFDLIRRTGGPTSLRDLGMAEADLDRAAELATAQSYPNPRELTRTCLADLLCDAWRGRRPQAAAGSAPDLRPLTDEVVASFDGCANPRLRQLLTDPPALGTPWSDRKVTKPQSQLSSQEAHMPCRVTLSGISSPGHEGK
ncbi:iron-containing alcohol dehydrogenase [Streptomyces ossamyceticus]|uniref:Iron-containing alcohol dehydrogenase n=1 Tax=Streptomyces ossamyceticus TaxID=249581 RepID=A0ABV2UQX3_9ACTN